MNRGIDENSGKMLIAHHAYIMASCGALANLFITLESRQQALALERSREGS
jgi:hypothetical protein